MGQRVKRVRTPVSQQQLSQSISEVWSEMFGDVPSKEQVAMVLAQNALETGNRKSMWNYNVGNITTNGAGVYDYFDDLETKEQMKPGVWKSMNLKYRAYPSLKDGVRDYLKFLSGKSYQNAWQHIVNPNPELFSKELKKSKYYTANEEPYTKAIKKYYQQFSGTKDLPEIPPQKHVTELTNVPESLLESQPENVYDMIDNLLRMVASTDIFNIKTYKTALPKHNFIVKISSNNIIDSIEFARILCSAAEEELHADAYTHTDGENVEVQCDVNGSAELCKEVLAQLTDSVNETFSEVIDNANIKTVCSENISSLKPIDFDLAEECYNQFLLNHKI